MAAQVGADTGQQDVKAEGLRQIIVCASVEAKDLIGRKVGVPEYQITAATWVRGILEHEFGVRPRDVSWHTGGQRTPGRVEKQHINVGEGVHIESLPEGHTLDEAIASGEIARRTLTFSSRTASAAS